MIATLMGTKNEELPGVWLDKHPRMVAMHPGTLDSETKDCPLPSRSLQSRRETKTRNRSFLRNAVGDVRAKQGFRPRKSVGSGKVTCRVFFLQRQVCVEQRFPKGVKPFKHFDNHRFTLTAAITIEWRQQICEAGRDVMFPL